MGYNLGWFVNQPYSTRAFLNLERPNHLSNRIFLYLEHKNLAYFHRVRLTNIGISGGSTVPVRSAFLRLGLAFNTRYTPFRFGSFTITFWEALLVNLRQWQSSTFEGLTGALNFENTFRTVSSSMLSSILSGIADICKHSLLEYGPFS